MLSKIGGMELVPDWSGLVPDLLEQIAKNLMLLEDFTAFRGVCTSWRYAVTKNKYKFKVPLLMLAEESPSHKFKMRKKSHSYTCKVGGLRKKKHPNYKYVLRNGYCSRKCKVYKLYRRKKNEESNEREFYSLSKREICSRLLFPEARDKKCIDVGFGWMLTVSALGGTKYGIWSFDIGGTGFGKFTLGYISDGRVSLVKPFYSSPEIQLPNLNTFPLYEESGRYPDFDYAAQAMLLADPSVTSDFMLVLLSNNYLLTWRNGDKQWTRITPEKSVWTFLNMVYYKGCVYALATHGRIWCWDPTGADGARRMMQVDGDAFVDVDEKMAYLVESTDGELLLIVRNNDRKSKRHKKGKLADFWVMKIDLETLTVEPKNSVGKDAIFVGNNTSVAVAAADCPGVLKPNCIYFTDDYISRYFEKPIGGKGGGEDMGIYNVEDESVERFNIQSYSHISTPMWIFPSF